VHHSVIEIDAERNGDGESCDGAAFSCPSRLRGPAISIRINGCPANKYVGRYASVTPGKGP